MNKVFLVLCVAIMALTTANSLLAEEKTYVGSESCKACHEQAAS